MKNNLIITVFVLCISTYKSQTQNTTLSNTPSNSYHYMVVKTNGNILDCPHFGNMLSNEAAKEFQIDLVEKNDEKRIIIFDISKSQTNVDSLKNNYVRYLNKIQFPMNYFNEIYFTNDKN